MYKRNKLSRHERHQQQTTKFQINIRQLSTPLATCAVGMAGHYSIQVYETCFKAKGIHLSRHIIY